MKSLADLEKENLFLSKKRRLHGVIIILIVIFSCLICSEYVILRRLELISRETLASKTPMESNHLSSTDMEVTRPSFAIHALNKTSDNFLNVRKVLEILGYTEVHINDDWNLLWGLSNPITSSPNLRERILKLKSHQMINHIPGIEFILNLTTSGVPTSFQLPQDKEKFQNYALKQPEKILMEQNNGNKNVLIKKLKDISLKTNLPFMQEFITKPLLVDGYKFDIGIYTVITSIEPLRIYIYTGDFLFRFCQQKFLPFNSNITAKYIVREIYRPTRLVPSLMKYYTQFGGNMRISFDAYMRKRGKDTTKIWEQAEEIIRYKMLTNVQKIAETWKPFNTRNFFQLIRFDLLIDTDLKVYLVEANFSPSMHSKDILHQQVLYNTFNLVGIGSPIKEQQNITRFGQRLIPVTLDKNLVSNIGECLKYNCDKECNNEECNLCMPCLDGNDYNILARAQREHIQRGDMRRIFPKPISNVEKFNLVEETKNLTVRDKWMTKWFYHKCLYDKSWCQ